MLIPTEKQIEKISKEICGDNAVCNNCDTCSKWHKYSQLVKDVILLWEQEKNV